MCEAMTIAAVAATLVTGYMAADAQKAQGEYNAQVAENNATLSRQRADDANAMGTRDMERQAWRTRAIMGQQRAAIAASGLDPTMGTPAEILGESALFGEIDQQNIRLNAARQAWGFRADASNFDNDAMLSRWSGRTQSRMTILGSLGQAASMGAGAWGGGGSAASGSKFTKSGSMQSGVKSGSFQKAGW